MGDPEIRQQMRSKQNQYSKTDLAQSRFSGADQDGGKGKSFAKSWKGGLVGLIILVLIVGAVWLFFTSDMADRSSNFINTMNSVNQEQYQAVFLSNGQVYFGKVTDLNSDAMVLEDIYYLQVDQQIQPEQEDLSQEPNINLIKLGEELHGPEDKMYINTSEIVYWENLRTDGDVTQAIDRYVRTGGTPTDEQPGQENSQQNPTEDDAGTEE